MKKLIALCAFCFVSTTVTFGQDINFSLYKGDRLGSTALQSEAEKQGAKLNQPGTDGKTWDYGKIEKASTGVRFFKFTNTGDAPLVIQNAKGSCGCTVPSYPKEPIMPGATEFIKVKYDTKRVGNFTKSVTLTTNSKTNTSTRLLIKGVVEKEAAATPVKSKSMFGG